MGEKALILAHEGTARFLLCDNVLAAENIGLHRLPATALSPRIRLGVRF